MRSRDPAGTGIDMDLKNGLGERAVRDVIGEDPRVGEILARHGVACATCAVGVCLLKDVVGIHALGAEAEARLAAELDALRPGGGPVAPVPAAPPPGPNEAGGAAAGGGDITSLMVEEHRLILRMIALLEREVAAAGAGRAPRPEFLLDAVDFIRSYADRFHHAKEEDVLFKELVANGMPAENSPVAAMLLTHDEGRAHVRALEAAAMRMRDGDAAAAGEAARSALAYAALLRDHIAKEDGVLYPLAERILPDAVRPRMREAYRKAGRGKAAYTAERCRYLVERYEEEAANA